MISDIIYGFFFPWLQAVRSKTQLFWLIILKMGGWSACSPGIENKYCLKGLTGELILAALYCVLVVMSQEVETLPPTCHR